MERARRCLASRRKKITELLEEQAYAKNNPHVQQPIEDADDDLYLRSLRATDESLALKAWNLAGGMEWDGVLLAAECFGIDDIEMLIHRLATIRDFLDRKRREEME